MSVSLTVNDADYSANAVGWEAPTTVQPKLAFLPTSSTFKNLSPAGNPLTVLGTAPTFTAGVKGTSLPGCTLGGTSGFATNMNLPPQSTVLVLSKSISALYNILGASIPSGEFLYGMRPNVNNALIVGSDNVIVNATETVFNTYQIKAFTLDFSTVNVALAYRNLTTGVIASGTKAFSAVPSLSTTMNIGYTTDTTIAATWELNGMLIYDSILSADDMNSAVAWLRLLAQSYGISA
ncbi:hypothetical protein NBRC3299_0304 [Acetobacter pasteurianus NBRC 3299]|nr:hypothetical protein BBA71_06440 [Acetobacter pasteurianus]GCD74012.1 hypothetical protein NBRC3299_0304 [Acetobacter pasteurianus NBRC 3299]